MYQWLKDHFIPHEGNNGRPHFLRKEMTVIVVALVLLLEALYLLQSFVVIPHSRFLSEVISSVLIEETNQKRQSGDLSGLAFNSTLEAAAKLKAEDMAKRGYFSHNTPDGKTPWYFLEQVGYAYQTAGENLAVNFTESSDVTEAWMRSPGHRANILNGNYTEIGIATAKGTYKGSDAIFVVQFFGKPRTLVGQGRIAETSPLASIATTTTRISTTTTQVLGNATTSAPLVATNTPKIKTPVVLGEEITPEPKVALPVAVSEDVPSDVFSSTTPQDLSGSVASDTFVLLETHEEPNLWVRIALSPRSIISYALIIIGSVVFLSLVLLVVVRVRRDHTHLIGNGILVLSLICLMYLINLLLSGAFGAVL